MSEPLVSMLLDAGRGIEYPATPDFELAAERAPKQRVRPLLVAAAIAAVVLIVLAFPGPRAAIAELFGIGAVEFQIVDEIKPSALTGSLPGKEVGLDEATEGVEFVLLTIDEMPDLVFLDDSVAGGMVTLGYGQSGTGYRVVITQLHARSDEPSLRKLLSGETSVTPVDVDGDQGFWIEGEHTVVLLDQDDQPIFHSARLAASTLLVVANDLTIRIEGDLTVDEAIGIARELN